MQTAEPTHLLRLDAASYFFKRFRALSEITLTIASGELIGVRGGNGSGKTTLLRGLSGIIQPKHGRRHGNPTVAYVPAAMDPPVMPAGTWLQGFRHHITDPREALEMLAFRGDLAKPCTALSFGNMRKLMVAEALSSPAQLIVIDEARAGFDDAGNDGLNDLTSQARQRGSAVVIADQDSHAIGHTDQLWRLRDGVLETVVDSDRMVTAHFRGPVSDMRELLALARSLGLEFHE